MSESPGSYARRVSTHPPKEMPGLSGTFKIERSKVLDFIKTRDNEGDDIKTKTDYRLKNNADWEMMPTDIRFIIEPQIRTLLRINPHMEELELIETIWRYAAPHLETRNLYVEVEEENDPMEPGRYCIVSKRLVLATAEIRKNVTRAIDTEFDDDEIPTTPGTPSTVQRKSEPAKKL